MKLPVWFVPYVLAFYSVAIASLVMLSSVRLLSRVYVIVMATVSYVAIGLLLKFRKSADVHRFFSSVLPIMAVASSLFALFGIAAWWQSHFSDNFREHPALGPSMSIGFGILAAIGFLAAWRARKRAQRDRK